MNPEKHSRKLPAIRILMIISQIVLTIFVIQWLLSEFRKESDLLNQELMRKFDESGMEVLDSLLLLKVVNPVIADKIHLRYPEGIERDTVLTWKFKGKTGNRFMMSDSISDGKKFITICTEDSMFFGQDGMNPKELMIQSQHDVILHGVRLLVQKVEDSVYIASDSTFFPGQLEDSSRFRRIFSGKVMQLDPILNVGWTTYNRLKDKPAGHAGDFVYIKSASNYVLKADIRNHGLSVLKETAPSFLFALFLLILTGLSFTIAFRNLKNQIRLNRMRNSFVSNISHELKTPVSTVKVALEALNGFNLKQDRAISAEYLALAEKEMTRLEKLIDQILKVSIYENDNSFLNREDIDAGKLAEEAADVIRSLNPGRELNIRIIKEGEDLSILADPLHFRGVMINILDNAVKYGNDKPEIEIQLISGKKEITINIRDNGKGIPEEYLNRIFDKFFRVPGGDLHDVKGYGLGLSYAAMIIRQHGGSVSARNHATGGALFIIKIPRN
ncbi:MAG: hypothetical protein KKA81_06775 [Bacteroidetes bacterium]|nr:hypothetical protein [Bacteroidota bacterium]